jgi:hypothetical protein
MLLICIGRELEVVMCPADKTDTSGPEEIYRGCGEEAGFVVLHFVKSLSRSVSVPLSLV